MEEPHVDAASEPDDHHPHQNEDDVSHGSRLILWAVASLVFLVYLAFGSVEARIWRFNRLNFEDRQITDVWAYMGANLPPMPAQPLFTTLFFVSIAVMVIGAVWGLWFFLADDPASHESAPSGRSSTADDV